MKYFVEWGTMLDENFAYTEERHFSIINKLFFFLQKLSLQEVKRYG